jgi:hypothetical protein
VSHIDGRKVNYRGKTTWIGLVQGDAPNPGHVRVLWDRPKIQTGIHKVTDLVVIDAPPSQEELSEMFEPPKVIRHQ